MGFFSKLFGTDPETQKKKRFAELERDKELLNNTNLINQAKAIWLTYRGKHFSETGKVDLAFHDFDEAIKISPDYLPAYLCLSRTHLVLRDYQQALSAIKNAPSNKGGNDFEILMQKLLVYLAMDDKENALCAAEEALVAAELPTRKKQQELLKLSSVAGPLSDDTETLKKIKEMITELKQTKAFSKMLVLAEQGNPVAQRITGLRYKFGIGVQKNQSSALVWFQRAADKGDMLAQLQIGFAYYNGVNEYMRDHATAMQWIRRAAEGGLAIAQHELGIAYSEGDGVAKDDVEALKWFHKASEQGNTSAQVRIGSAYFDGLGVSKSEEEAFKWHYKAALRGDQLAQSNIGNMYLYGRGTPKDLIQAYTWHYYLTLSEEDTPPVRIAKDRCEELDQILSVEQVNEAKSLARNLHIPKAPSFESEIGLDFLEN